MVNFFIFLTKIVLKERQDRNFSDGGDLKGGLRDSGVKGAKCEDGLFGIEPSGGKKPRGVLRIKEVSIEGVSQNSGKKPSFHGTKGSTPADTNMNEPVKERKGLNRFLLCCW